MKLSWKRTGSHGGAKRWGPAHDIVLFYTRSETYTWNRGYQDFSPDYIEKYYRSKDERGMYQSVSLTGDGIRTGNSGQPWRDINPTDIGRHWAIPKTALQNAYPGRADLDTLSTQERLDLLDKAGLIHWPKRGSIPRQKRYATESEGALIQDVVGDIKPVGAHARERMGYPTQKPLALMERIIKASSNERDIVLDPFCGCATTCIAAEKLQRNWIGIDVSHKAYDLVIERLNAEVPPGPVQRRSGIQNGYSNKNRYPTQESTDRGRQILPIWKAKFKMLRLFYPLRDTASRNRPFHSQITRRESRAREPATPLRAL